MELKSHGRLSNTVNLFKGGSRGHVFHLQSAQAYFFKNMKYGPPLMPEKLSVARNSPKLDKS